MLVAMLAAHIIHYTIEFSELLLHGKNANFVDLFWKNASKGGGAVWAFEILGKRCEKMLNFDDFVNFGIGEFFCCLV